jgi:hypothetical protein
MTLRLRLRSLTAGALGPTEYHHHLLRSDADADLLNVSTDLIVGLNGNACHLLFRGPDFSDVHRLRMRVGAIKDRLPLRLIQILSHTDYHLHPQAPKDIENLSSSVYHRLPRISGMEFIQTSNTVVAVRSAISKAKRTLFLQFQ